MDAEKLKFLALNLLIYVGTAALMFFASRNYWMNESHSRDGVKLAPNEELVASKTDVQIIHDSVKNNFYTKDIKTIVKDSLVFVPAVVDTAAIISKYFTEKFAMYELKDSNITLNAWYKIFKNDVKFDSIKYKLFTKTIKETTTNVVAIHRPRLGIGMFASGNQTGINTFGPLINLSTRKLNVGAGYDVLGRQVHVSVCANFYKR